MISFCFVLGPCLGILFEDDLQDFRALLKGEAKLAKAMKQFAKRGKARAGQVEEDWLIFTT